MICTYFVHFLVIDEALGLLDGLREERIEQLLVHSTCRLGDGRLQHTAQLGLLYRNLVGQEKFFRRRTLPGAVVQQPPADFHLNTTTNYIKIDHDNVSQSLQFCRVEPVEPWSLY